MSGRNKTGFSLFYHTCVACSKPIPCTRMCKTCDAMEDSNKPCKECDALQIETEAPDGAVTAQFFCCDEHMYDRLLMNDSLFGQPADGDTPPATDP